MNIALIICIPITAIVVGFFVLFSVRLGLKWQMQVKEGKEPTIETPISQVVEAVQESKANKQMEQARILNEKIMNEWRYGKEGE